RATPGRCSPATHRLPVGHPHRHRSRLGPRSLALRQGRALVMAPSTRLRLNMTPGALRATVFLLLLSLLLARANLLLTAREVGGVRAAETRSAQNAANITQLCLLGNEARAQQIVLWEHIVQIAQPPPRETPAQRRARLATTRTFVAYLHKVFAPRDCARPHAT